MKISLGAKPLALPAPVWAVSTYDPDGKPNSMIAAWGGLCSSQPPCLTVSVRPSRHTYRGLTQRKAFTVGVVSEAFAAQGDYLGMISGKKTDKFADTGLTPVRSDVVDAPYIEEFPLSLECRLIHSYELGVHIMVVGEILDVKADEDKLIDGKFPDIEKMRPLIFSPGSRAYHTVGDHVGQGFDMGRKYVK
ncbi:flavin reductase family protein [Pseudodesulfovibrio tunisiensis]|uniref:flavin reductase family protein n=1 Tax=Pseudodesulfovibrio tunisiensis TaxID=463192 RepID=UPI001FB2C6B2|nr:flavin reductase family protein [Pseudodesulfovibrio tunisiensis]